MNKILLGVAAAFLSVGLLGGADRAPTADLGVGSDAQRLAAYQAPDRSRHVFSRDADGSIQEWFASATATDGWHKKNLTAEAAAPKAAGSPTAYVLKADKTQHVVYRSTDDQIVELYWAGGPGKWQFNNLSTVTRAPKAAGNPSGFVVEKDRTQHIVYRTADNNICELYLTSKPGSPWAVNNLSQSVGKTAPKAAGDPCSYVLKDNSRHVVFRDKDGNIHELYESGAGAESRWMAKDLTTMTKAPRAAGNPHAFQFEDNQTQHIVYRTEGGDIGELYLEFKPGKDWAFNNLTHDTKVPKAAGDPFGYALKGNSQHATYRDKDGNIQELFTSAEVGKWEANDLTTLTKAPKAAGDPVGFGMRTDETQHIFFRTKDGNVGEFYHTDRPDDKTWHFNNLSAAATTPAGRTP
jgi:catechol 2,3-dioxygenase-like lactoylglutathione lyase family enzyme